MSQGVAQHLTLFNLEGIEENIFRGPSPKSADNACSAGSASRKHHCANAMTQDCSLQ
jgi:hypothetical protein